MVKAVCEECFYTADKTEFEEYSDYCTDCVCEHAMCPKCKTGYHSALITEWNQKSHHIKYISSNKNNNVTKQWRER